MKVYAVHYDRAENSDIEKVFSNYIDAVTFSEADNTAREEELKKELLQQFKDGNAIRSVIHNTIVGIRELSKEVTTLEVE